MSKVIRLPATEPAIGHFDWHGSVDEYCEQFDDMPVIVERPDFHDPGVMHTQRVPLEFFKMIHAKSNTDHGWRVVEGLS